MSQTKQPSLSRDTAAPQYWLYILSNAKPSGPLYLGDTTDLIVRMEEHHAGLRRDYAHYHRLDRLVYFEVWDDLDKFNARLRRVRNWPRDMRLLLIESLNPDWEDLQPRLREQAEHGQKPVERDEEKAA
ncbi:MAG TPA: GIY-YIG nuclease family protein [Limnobacter sp.]|nr:GIY-YIG nuclease family protein [Limnobacter sp.]